MKNSFTSLKRIFVDNKDYFIKCTLMSIIAAFILCIAISITVPASAAGDPTENNRAIIPAGTYRINDDASPFIHFFDKYNQTEVEEVFDLYSFPIEPTQYPIEGITVTVDSITPLIAYEYITAESKYEVTQIQNISAEGYGEAIVTSDTEVLVFTIPEDTDVSAEVATWITNNTTIVSSDDDPLLFTIEAGWYLWNDVMLEMFNPTTLEVNFRTYQRDEGSGIPYYSYWSSMVFDNYTLGDSLHSRLYYSSFSNGRVLVYDSTDGGWANDIYRRFYISSPLTLSAEDYFVFLGYTEYYGDTPPTFPDEPIPSVPDPDDPDTNILTNIIGGVLDALDAFVIIGGFSLLDLISTLLGGMALVWILKLLAGG